MGIPTITHEFLHGLHPDAMTFAHIRFLQCGHGPHIPIACTDDIIRGVGTRNIRNDGLRWIDWKPIRIDEWVVNERVTLVALHTLSLQPGVTYALLTASGSSMPGNTPISRFVFGSTRVHLRLSPLSKKAVAPVLVL